MASLISHLQAALQRIGAEFKSVRSALLLKEDDLRSKPAIEMGQSLAGNRNIVIDLHADDTNLDYSTRIIRYGGPDGEVRFVNVGAGPMRFFAESFAFDHRPAFAGAVPWDSANLATPLADKGEIGDAVDLNTLIATGVYHQRLVSYAVNGANYPAPTAGRLEVFNGASGGHVYQTYTTYYSDARVFVRVYYSGSGGGWSSWRQVWDSVSAVNALAPAVCNAAAPDLSKPVQVLTLEANTTLGAPVNVKPGTTGMIHVRKTVANLTLAYHASWLPYGATPAISTDIAQMNTLVWTADEGSKVGFSLSGARAV